MVLVGSDLKVRTQLFGLLAGHGISVLTADDAADAIARVNAMEAFDAALVLAILQAICETP